MNILLVTMQFPCFPGPGGETRQFCLIRELAKKHEITILTISPPPNDQAYKELKKICRDIIFSKKRDIMSLFYRRLFYPSLARKFLSSYSDINRILHDVLNNYDIVQVEHSQIAFWIDKYSNKNIRKVLSLHNVNSVLARRYYDKMKSLTTYTDWLKTRFYEKNLGRLYDLFITVSEEEKKEFQGIIPGSVCKVVPSGVDTDYFCVDNAGVQPEKAVVFTGLMAWGGNVDAIRYFHSEIMPLLSNEFKDLKVFVVGKNPSNKILELKKDRRFIVTGEVPDVRPYIRKASVFICPLRLGAGTRLKILEAMAMGKAVVSTSIGCEGLDVTNGKNILIADSPADFASRIELLISNDFVRNEMGKNARRLVESQYCWQKIAEKMNEVYETII